MRILFLLLALFTFSRAEDFQTSLSNRSVNFIYSMLPILNPLFKEKEFNGFSVIDIDYFIQVQLLIEKIVLHSLVLNKSNRNSMQQLSENEYILTFPEINLNASCEVNVTKGMFSDLGNVELTIQKFIIQVTVEFNEEDGVLQMIPKDYKFDYEKFDVDIENQFIKYIWKILVDHSFVKKYIMKQIGQKISSYIDGVNLYQIAQFQIKDEVFLFGLSEKPLFIEDGDEFFIVTKIDLRKLNSISTPLENQDYKNLMFTAKVPKISQLLKLVLNNKEYLLNDIKLIADKLTVQNLQLAFPELATLYSDKMNTLMNVKLSLNFNDLDPLVNRDYNTFLFQNVEINLQEKETEKQVCTLQLNSFINIMLSSGELEKSIVYVNMPSMRIIDLKAKDCLFDVQTDQYKNILENLFKINLLSQRKYSFQDYQQIATGPYVYTKGDRFYFGLNIELDL